MSKATKAAATTTSAAAWLMKSEPDEFSIDDLERDGTTLWEGVRNYQARNFIRSMGVGDAVLFYHSNTKVPGIVGVGAVTRAPFADPSQFVRGGKYYDAATTKENPRWTTVEVSFREKLPQIVSLDALRDMWNPASDCAVVRAGNRLSVCPVFCAAAVAKALAAGGSKMGGKVAGTRRQRGE